MSTRRSCLLSEASPSGLFSVRLPDNRLSVWKRDRTGQSGIIAYVSLFGILDNPGHKRGPT